MKMIYSISFLLMMFGLFVQQLLAFISNISDVEFPILLTNLLSSIQIFFVILLLIALFKYKEELNDFNSKKYIENLLVTLGVLVIGFSITNIIIM